MSGTVLGPGALGLGEPQGEQNLLGRDRYMIKVGPWKFSSKTRTREE